MHAPHLPVWITAPAAQHAIGLAISIPSNAPFVLPPGIFLEHQFHGVCVCPVESSLVPVVPPPCLVAEQPSVPARRCLLPDSCLASQHPPPVLSTAQKPFEIPQMCPAVSQPWHVLSPVCAALSSPFLIQSFLLSEPLPVPQAQGSCPSGLHSLLDSFSQGTHHTRLQRSASLGTSPGRGLSITIQAPGRCSVNIC